jgi:hypothetical protein
MHEFTKTGPLDEPKLQKIRERLAKMSDAELVKFYEASIHMCQLDRGKAPRAPFIQQLVQAWRELTKREKTDVH